MSSPLPVVHNVSLRRFEDQTSDAPLSFLSYKFEGDWVVFDHTPGSIEMTGIALIVLCGAVSGWRTVRT